MNSLVVGSKVIELNQDGFLVNPQDWTEDVARVYAEMDRIGDLTESHWKIIYYLRDYYRQFQIAPMVRKLCKETGVSVQDLENLFPSGPAKGACKLAGLPKPTGCL